MADKNRKIIDVVKHLQEKYGAKNILVKDHWESDENAIGLADKSEKYLGYIYADNEKDGYYLALENPPVDNNFPYSPAGEFNNVSLTELENLLSKHLRLFS